MTALVLKFAKPLSKASFAACLRPHRVTVGVGPQAPRPLGKASYRRLPSPQNGPMPPWKAPQASAVHPKPLGKPQKISATVHPTPKSESTFDEMTTRYGEAKHGPLITIAIRERSDRTKRERAKRATEPKASAAPRTERAAKRSAATEPKSSPTPYGTKKGLNKSFSSMSRRRQTRRCRSRAAGLMFWSMFSTPMGRLESRRPCSALDRAL